MMTPSIPTTPEPEGIELMPDIISFPIVHGRAVFPLLLRKYLWKQEIEKIAVALPESLLPGVKQGIDSLPILHTLVVKVLNKPIAFLPFDPCDGYVEAMRQAYQKRIPLEFIEDDLLLQSRVQLGFPDVYLVGRIGLKQYLELSRPGLSEVAKSADNLHRAALVLPRLRKMKDKGKLLFVCDFPLLIALQNLLQSEPSSQKEGTIEIEPELELHPTRPELAYFAMKELPFYAGQMEKERSNPLAVPLDYLDMVKKVFSETRNHYLSRDDGAEEISVKKLQIALVFLRNLCVQEQKLTPDLTDLVIAAKGVFGHSFAAKVLQAAKYYPFFDPITANDPHISIGIDEISVPPENEPVTAINLLEDEAKMWKTIRLRPDPDRKKQSKYRYQWDPRGMCSHTPEDERIEHFNQNVRAKVKEIMDHTFTRSEEMTSSFKDGLDVRETLRNWHSGKIYVKEVPFSHGKTDTVVVLFDEENENKYPNRTTWYAEHNEESTLCFYATDPMEKMIGPGIAEAYYGGLSLLFPPRTIPDVFQFTSKNDFQNVSEQLLYGALYFSQEKVIALVSKKQPGMRKKMMAEKMGKKLTWIPLQSYSNETMRRLRKFHILNGKHVRSWAGRFILE